MTKECQIQKTCEFVVRKNELRAEQRQRRRRNSTFRFSKIRGLAWFGFSVVYIRRVSKKSGRIAEMIQGLRGKELDAHYLGYFECFNQRLFYEAHDVLEELWLGQRGQANDLFYKGLIQLAGAFVHLQKNRLKPSAALFKLARTNISKYPARHEALDVTNVLELIETWLGKLEAGNFEVNPLQEDNAPKLSPLPC